MSTSDPKARAIPLPSQPSVEQQRIMKRRSMVNLTEEELWNYPDASIPKPEELFKHRPFSPLAGIAIEESICRIIAKHIPEARVVVIIEDTSHDSPHGHIQYILDKEQHILMDGGSDEWHDLDWTNEANDLAWDLYYIASPLFTTHRGYHYLDLPVKV